MAEQNIESKLKNLLKQEKIQLWSPPYTQLDNDNQPGTQHMQELAERYALMMGLSIAEVGGALESIRVQAVKRGKRNQTFRETSVATLELQLPKDCKKDLKAKDYLETRLDVLVQEVVDRIGEKFGLRFIKLILNGKTLSLDQRLDLQGVKNHSKVMVLRVSDTRMKQQLSQDEKKNHNESLQRSQKGFQILSERDGSQDPDTTPFLEIADQKGNPLKIPERERKALILAMGLHEKGRSLMKRKQYDDALCHLLQADQHFSGFDSALLSSVDNYAVLQLDIVWCYRALEALHCLSDAGSRLQRAERCFLQCYGEQRQRLLRIKGNSGTEEVLFLRLYLLQSLLSYLNGDDSQARQQLSKVELLYNRLCLDSDKVEQLMALGFTEREVRLGLRACGGDPQKAAIHISNCRQREELRQRERMKRRTRMEAIATLTELGYSRNDAARALHHADGDINRASEVRLVDLGFDRDLSETALRLTGGDIPSATQLLLDNQGVLTPPSTSSASSSPSSEDPASASTSTSAEDDELVNEVLGDISRHEDDYLDLTLEEEMVLQLQIKGPTSSCDK
uniref:Negative regulator of ubiquitin-like proteins 1 n=1 Tax=Mastacembelus armatus TaxID=205130 RepID=A0A7N8XCW1_9TELE